MESVEVLALVGGHVEEEILLRNVCPLRNLCAFPRAKWWRNSPPSVLKKSARLERARAASPCYSHTQSPDSVIGRLPRSAFPRSDAGRDVFRDGSRRARGPRDQEKSCPRGSDGDEPIDVVPGVSEAGGRVGRIARVAAPRGVLIPMPHRTRGRSARRLRGADGRPSTRPPRLLGAKPTTPRPDRVAGDGVPCDEFRDVVTQSTAASSSSCSRSATCRSFDAASPAPRRRGFCSARWSVRRTCSLCEPRSGSLACQRQDITRGSARRSANSTTRLRVPSRIRSSSPRKSGMLSRKW